MKLSAAAAMGAILIAVVVLVSAPRAARAAPPLQLPWPTGEQHRIYGGNTYGCGTHGGTGYETNYYAIDFAFSIGQNVAPAAGGTVTIASIRYNNGAGNYLAVDHGDGFVSRYLHLRATSPFATGIGVGTVVSQGRLIGYSGNTGGVPAHLHFDLKLDGGAYKPEPMSGVPAPGEHSFGWYGHSLESGLNPPSRGCIIPYSQEWYDTGCTWSTCAYVNDPSPYWASLPSFNRDFGIDTCSDVMARSSSIAKVYAGNCQTGFAGSYQIASGLLNYNKLLQTGDFNGDRCIDMLAVHNSTGIMYLYPGAWSGSPGNCTAAFGTRIQIGSGWNAYLDLFGPGDFDGDGCNDVMGRNVAWTTLYLWRGNCGPNPTYWRNGGMPIAVGSGWTARDKVWSVGDFDADGCLDIMARDNPTSAVLFLYRGGCGNGGVYWRNGGSGIQVGSGFIGMNELIGPGDFARNYDTLRCTDLIWKLPPAYLYVGNCGGPPWFGNNDQGISTGEYFTSMTLVP